MSDVSQSDDVRPRWKMALPAAVVGVPLRKFVFGGIASLAAVIGLGVGLLHTELFAVNRIDITGLRTMEKAAVLDRSGVTTGEFLVRIDGASIESKLEADPWIASASVDRDWPHAVKITVKERTPVAIAQTADKKWALVGDGGTVLEVTDLPRSGLPYVLDIQAPASPGEKLDAKADNLVKVGAIMPESLRPRVVQMQDAEEGIRLGLDAGTIVVLGKAEDLPAKLMSAAAVISKSDPSKIAILDVTSPESPLATPIAAARPPTNAGNSSSQASSDGTAKTKSTSTTIKKSSSGGSSTTVTAVRSTPDIFGPAFFRHRSAALGVGGSSQRM